MIAITALPAKACSCAMGDPRDQLASSDGAFIGTLVSQTPDPDDNTFSSIYTFSVDEEVKTELGGTVEVHSASNGAACGLEVPVGGQTGLFLQLSDGEWHSNLCQQIDPDQLRDAAQPLPEPDGVGAIKLLVSGSYGEMGIMALDGQGRTLAYGERQPDSSFLRVCPGSQRFLELHGTYRRPKIAVRDTSTLEVLHEVNTPFGRRPYRDVSPADMSCADAQGDVIYLAGTKYGGTDEDFVLKLEEGTASRIYKGKVGDFHFDGTDLYLTEGGRGRFLVKLDLSASERDGIATVPSGSMKPRVSPNGEWLAVVAGQDKTKLVVIERATGDVRVRALGQYQFGEPLWLGNQRIAFLPGGGDNSHVHIYSRNLAKKTVVPGDWYSGSNALVGGTAYGVGWGTLYKAPLPDGPAEALRVFDSPQIYYVTAVPDEVQATTTP